MQTVDERLTNQHQAELLALAVHEFRTPVTVVGGYLRMLSREQVGPLNDRQKKLIEESERSCARLSALVAELSELANLDADTVALARQDVPLLTLLQDAVERVDDGRDRDIVVEITGADAGAVVAADRTRITSAIAALLRAVVREQTEAGRVLVHVEVRGGDDGPAGTIAIAREGQLPGTAEPAGDRALNEYRGGMGLSVPIARRVIARHGGRVWSSAAGRLMGAVTVRLPLREIQS